MKRGLLILILTIAFYSANADHISGGEMYYTYTGFANGLHQYRVTLKLFMRCNSDRMFPDPIIMSIFDRATNERIKDTAVHITSRTIINLNNPDPCITDPPQVCYEVAYYDFNIFLPSSAEGYIIASEVNFRIRGISNFVPGGQIGATYTCEIPGTSHSTGPVNNSAAFIGSDLVIVCANNYFEYSFAAKDDDNDQLQYTFCAAYNGSTAGVNGVPAGTPPYTAVPYFDPDFTETSPLGIRVGIDPLTGLITGVAPEQGIYVVTVCVTEIRDGVVIATQRKDLQLNIAACDVVSAQLDPEYMLCGTTRTLSLANQSNSPLILSYEWAIFNPGGANIFHSVNAVLDYTFPVNGKYRIRLIINNGQPCTDTTFTDVYVFPGLVTDFESTGICFTKPTLFTDRSTLVSGAVNSWNWDFGEPGPLDISTSRNPSYTYPSLGVKTIRMIITTTDGCRDTLTKNISIIEKPPITLAFRDTLICLNDRIPLHASGTGNFTWTPLLNIENPLSATPVVSPATTQVYYVNLNADGCINNDSVKISVVDHVTLHPMGDTTICSGDTIQLRTVSDGLRFNWTPVSQVFDPSVPNPFVITSTTTPYTVTATIGGCTASNSIMVTAVPYPLLTAGNDTAICYKTTAQLHLQTNGSSWQWAPASLLNNPLSLSPIAHPVKSTSFIASAYNPGSGCPKPSSDTMLVTVLPKINAYAGRDTAVIVRQPLQLNASGGENYAWYPLNFLSNYNIPNPIAIFPQAAEGLRYKVIVSNSSGCADSAFINIKVYATGPTVFVPSAFTPNNDGRNDWLRPVAVGMLSIENFSIYNRWGQLVYSGKANDRGWDGRFDGQIQASNTFVWMVRATDFTGTPYFQKGTVTLVR